ncbi:MAG TPA: redoxin domain-containing protein [Acidobacteriota bacterium]|nr:redoxin domain-containing protein [Acidobacteriota bacterium]
MSDARPGDPAPGFDLPLVGGGFRGLADVVQPGGGVILFLKATCETSRLVAPRLQPLARALEKEERLFLAVAQEDEAGARALRDELGLRYPIVWEGPPYAASAAYDVTTVPTLLVVDGAGFVAERVEGFVKREYLELGAGVEQALALGDIPAVLEGPESLPDLQPG